MVEQNDTRRFFFDGGGFRAEDDEDAGALKRLIGSRVRSRSVSVSIVSELRFFAFIPSFDGAAVAAFRVSAV